MLHLFAVGKSYASDAVPSVRCRTRCICCLATSLTGRALKRFRSDPLTSLSGAVRDLLTRASGLETAAPRSNRATEAARVAVLILATPFAICSTALGSPENLQCRLEGFKVRRCAANPPGSESGLMVANAHPVKRCGLPQRRIECMGFRRMDCPATGTEAIALNPRVCSCVR
jgi:hypothetical protein